MQIIIRNISDDLHKSLKIIAAQQSKTLNAVMIEAAEAKVKKETKIGGPK